MKKVFALCLAVAFLIAMQTVIAAPPNVTGGPLKKADEMKNNPAKVLNSRRADAPWILDWYGPDGGYMDNGGFKATAAIDLIKIHLPDIPALVVVVAILNLMQKSNWNRLRYSGDTE